MLEQCQAERITGNTLPDTPPAFSENPCRSVERITNTKLLKKPLGTLFWFFSLPPPHIKQGVTRASFRKVNVGFQRSDRSPKGASNGCAHARSAAGLGSCGDVRPMGGQQLFPGNPGLKASKFLARCSILQKFLSQPPPGDGSCGTRWAEDAERGQGGSRRTKAGLSLKHHCIITVPHAGMGFGCCWRQKMDQPKSHAGAEHLCEHDGGSTPRPSSLRSSGSQREAPWLAFR